jgi:hypothetical protein
MSIFVARAEDAVKGVPLNALPDSAWQYLTGSGDGDAAGITGITAYQRVPWVYRATRLRANKLGNLPYKLTRLDDNDTDLATLPEYQPLIGKLRSLIARTEAALCLYGAAYNVLETNRYGMRRSLRWLLPTTITPQIDTDNGLTGFRRARGNSSMIMPPFDPAKPQPGQILWYWEPNISGEEGPGQSVAYAALRKAHALDRMDAAVQQFFERGMIRATILTVDGNPPQAEMTKLEAWWKRLFSGVKGAWNTAAFRAAVRPQVIGDGLESVTNTALNEDQVQSIIATFGVPMSLILSNAANYATAVQDALAMYSNTVLPQWYTVHSEPLNAYLALDGLRLSVEESSIEEYQSHQLEQALQITQLVGQPVMLVDEGRAWLGLPPLATVRPAAPEPPLPAAPEPTDTTIDADQPELPDAVRSLTDAQRADMERWERKALKRLRENKSAAVSFESDTIVSQTRHDITAQLRTATTPAAVKAVFHAAQHTKAVSDLTPQERRVYNAILPILRASTDPAAAAILRGQTFDLLKLSEALRDALIPVLTQLYAENMLFGGALDIEFELPAEAINGRALTWAQTYTYDLVRGINETTAAALRDAFGVFNSTPGMTRAELEALLEPTFGPVRASMIAVTETTRTASEGVAARQQYLRDAGYNLTRIWRTNADDLVCPICGPLNGKAEADWGAVGPPPAHVNCRCATTLQLLGA